MAVNPGTTIVTFPHGLPDPAQPDKEALAVQLKLNEIVAALQGASNRLVKAEDMSEGDLEVLHSTTAAWRRWPGATWTSASRTRSKGRRRHREKHGGRKPSRPVK